MNSITYDKHVIVPNQLIIHYDIHACNHVCSSQLGYVETTAAEHWLSTSMSNIVYP